MKKQVVKRLVALVALAAMFMTFCGFSYLPNIPVPVESASLTVSSDGTAFEGVNASQARPDWFENPRFVDGKWGRSTASWKSGFPFLITNTEKFTHVNKVRISAEIYSARTVGNDEFNTFQVRYTNTSGAKVTHDVTISGGNDHIGQWKTYEVVIDDINLGAKNQFTTNRDCTFELYPNVVNSVEPLDENGEKLCEAYYGGLIHKVTVTPILDEPYTYVLKQNTAEGASWAANEENSEIEWVINTAGSLKQDSSVLTVTDKNGVTKKGKMSSSGATFGINDRACFQVPAAKYQDIHAVNIEVTYFDALNSDINTRGQFDIRWKKMDGSIAHTQQSWYTQHTGTWDKKVYTLTDVNFADSFRSDTQYNIEIFTGNKLQDGGTVDDTTDDIYGVLIADVKITPVPEYTFTNLKFTDSENTELKALNASGDFHTDLTVTRFGGDGEADITLIAVLCDRETGKLERIATNTKKIGADGIVNLSTCFVNPDDVTGKDVRIMVWDSLTGLLPISNSLICQ